MREECWKLQQLRLHSLQPGALYTLQEFQAAQAAQAEVAQERLERFSVNVTGIAQRLCYDVIEALEKELFGADNKSMKGLLQPGAQQRYAVLGYCNPPLPWPLPPNLASPGLSAHLAPP